MTKSDMQAFTTPLSTVALKYGYSDTIIGKFLTSIPKS